MENKIAFSFNYNTCPICEEKLDTNDYPEHICPNGCCEYQIDPQAGNVSVELFHGKWYIIPLYNGSFDEFGNDLSGDLDDFLEDVMYWKDKSLETPWNFQHSMPKLFAASTQYETFLKEFEYDDIKAIKQMGPVNRVRHVSRFLVNVDLSYELKHGSLPFILEFLEAIKDKTELDILTDSFAELTQILAEYQQLSEEARKNSTRSDTLSKKANDWAKRFSLKGNILTEIIEQMPDEALKH